MGCFGCISFDLLWLKEISVRDGPYPSHVVDGGKRGVSQCIASLSRGTAKGLLYVYVDIL